jgi:hypothetical protein
LILCHQKIKENRQKKEEKKKKGFQAKLDEFDQKMEEQRKKNMKEQRQKDLKNVDNYLKLDITGNSLVTTSDHYFKFRDFKMPTSKKYNPSKKTEHKRKETAFIPFNSDIYIYIYIYIFIFIYNGDLTQFSYYLYQIYDDKKNI